MLDTMWRVGVLALGVTLVALGLAMFVLPGPGFVVLILGLVVLASEFAWANRALKPVQDAAARAKQATLDPRRRKRNAIVAAIAGVIAGLLVTIYVSKYGLTLQPVLDLMNDIKDRLFD